MYCTCKEATPIPVLYYFDRSISTGYGKAAGIRKTFKMETNREILTATSGANNVS
jgi:hypothetical protein